MINIKKLQIVDHLESKALIDENNNVICMGTDNQLMQILDIFKKLKMSIYLVKGQYLGHYVEDGEVEYFLKTTEPIFEHG